MAENDDNNKRKKEGPPTAAAAVVRTYVSYLSAMIRVSIPDRGKVQLHTAVFIRVRQSR